MTVVDGRPTDEPTEADPPTVPLSSADVEVLRHLHAAAQSAKQPWQVVDAEQAIQHHLRLALPALLDAYEHQSEMRAEVERLSAELEQRDEADRLRALVGGRSAAPTHSDIERAAKEAIAGWFDPNDPNDVENLAGMAEAVAATVTARWGRSAAPTRDEAEAVERVRSFVSFYDDWDGERLQHINLILSAHPIDEPPRRLFVTDLRAVVALLSQSAAEPPTEVESLRRAFTVAHEAGDALWADRAAAHDVIRRLLAGQEISQTVRGPEWWGGEPDSDTPAAVTPEQQAVIASALRGVAAEPNEETESDG